ncbi:hypothetical protein PM082_022251 [Marasmius tenuissimus]|nr:hypothetical protein PM082_022251 [Marasmius tenuissimus]
MEEIADLKRENSKVTGSDLLPRIDRDGTIKIVFARAADPEPPLTTATNPSASTGSGAQGATNPNTRSSSTPPPPPPRPGQVNISHCARTMIIYLNDELVNSIRDIPSSGDGLEDDFFCQFFHRNLLNIEGDPDYHQC